MLSEAVISYALPLFCVATAGVMGWLIAYLNIAEDVARLILSVTENPIGVYLMIVAFLLVVGTVLSPITAVIIFLPILQHLGDVIGANPIQLGLVVVMCLTLGQVTPPYGICLLIAAQIGEISRDAGLCCGGTDSADRDGGDPDRDSRTGDLSVPAQNLPSECSQLRHRVRMPGDRPASGKTKYIFIYEINKK